MSALEQITQIEKEAETLRLRGDEPGYISKMREAVQKREDLKLQIEQEERSWEVEQSQQSEVRIQQARQEVTAGLSDIDGISLDVLCVNKEAANMVRIKTEDTIAKLVEKFNSEVAALHTAYRAQLSAADDRELQLKRQNDELQAKAAEAEQLQAENKELKEKLSAESLRADDAENKRDAAAAEAEQVKAELDRLKRGQTVSDEERSAQLEEAKRKFLESRIKVTNIRQDAEDFKGSTLMAELATTGETIRFNYLEKGRYLEVNEEEAARFRAETQSANANTTLEQPVEIPAPSIEVDTPSFPEQSEVPSGQREVEGNEPVEPVVEETEQVTLEGLAKRVTELERVVFDNSQSEVA